MKSTSPAAAATKTITSDHVAADTMQLTKALNATRARTNAAISTLISYQREHPRATEVLLQRGRIHCALLVSGLGNVTVWCRRTTGLKHIQLELEQGLQTSAVF